MTAFTGHKPNFFFVKIHDNLIERFMPWNRLLTSNTFFSETAVNLPAVVYSRGRANTVFVAEHLPVLSACIRRTSCIGVGKQ